MDLSKFVLFPPIAMGLPESHQPIHPLPPKDLSVEERTQGFLHAKLGPCPHHLKDHSAPGVCIQPPFIGFGKATLLKIYLCNHAV